MDWQDVKIAPPRRRPWFVRFAFGALLLLVVLVGTTLGYGAWVIGSSRPILSGTVQVAGLSEPVHISRDANGVPTIVASNRIDLARGLGFVHGQERFFQMDLLRRSGAGELAALLGPVALPVDRAHRLHRFQARAETALARTTPAQRALLDAYTAGVNAGLAALKHPPWEYDLLRMTPAPWNDEDTMLVVYAMYFDLEDSDASAQLLAAREQRVLGPALAN
ncbi:MAG TPA: penicillin acylase family protein, partial [Acetobacteraceae bacterium]|nr:penicillin acylase family protein [Acetobacteraceae bacterium]